MLRFPRNDYAIPVRRAWGLPLLVAVLLLGGGCGSSDNTPADSSPQEADFAPWGRKRPGPWRDVAESTDVEWLEATAMSVFEAAETANAADQPPPNKLCGLAYARLGELATRESHAAVARIEARARQVNLTPERVRLGLWPYPRGCTGDYFLQPIATARVANGTTYAVVLATILGGQDAFLIWSDTPSQAHSWSRPRLIPALAIDPLPADSPKVVPNGFLPRCIQSPSLAEKDQGTLLFSFVYRRERRSVEESMERRLELSIPEIRRDSDRDGWTDAEERRLGLNPNDADTDGDGINDGKDPCPDFSASDAKLPEEQAEILEKALFATVGLRGSRHLLVADHRRPRVHVWGLQAPLLYGALDPERPELRRWHSVFYVRWVVSVRTDASAEVHVDVGSGRGGATEQVRLRKIHGRWYVVATRVYVVS